MLEEIAPSIATLESGQRGSKKNALFAQLEDEFMELLEVNGCSTPDAAWRYTTKNLDKKSVVNARSPVAVYRLWFELVLV